MTTKYVPRIPSYDESAFREILGHQAPPDFQMHLEFYKNALVEAGYTTKYKYISPDVFSDFCKRLPYQEWKDLLRFAGYLGESAT